MINAKSVKVLQDAELALSVMHNVAEWLQKSGKNPSKWWLPQNMNRDFMLQHADLSEFYVGLVSGEPAVSAILQDNERNQSWKSIDHGKPQLALYIHWLCVNRKFAGKNLPKVMIDFAIQQARERNYNFVRLDTTAENL